MLWQRLSRQCSNKISDHRSCVYEIRLARQRVPILEHPPQYLKRVYWDQLTASLLAAPRSLMNDLKIFSGLANPSLTQDICRYLNLPMGKMSIGRFPDREISCKIDEDVRGRDIFIVQPTCPPVDEHLMELLVMIDSFKRASSYRITAVIPYFGYARQDRKDAGRVPITAKLVANLITRAGADRVLAMDLHAAQIQGFFRCPRGPSVRSTCTQ